jgi:RsiW-degrading membrane proteinase PrsW (M82 family)
MGLPLQIGIASPELFVILVLTVIVFAIPVVISVFIYRDARDRQSGHAVAWASASFFCALLGQFFGGVVFWVFYLVVRDEIGPREPTAADAA